MKINNATPIISNNSNANNKNVSFSGNFVNNMISKGKDFFVLERKGPMTRNLFIFNAYVFLLGTRFITSRDRNEKRETLTRDIPTIFVAAQGIPILKKWVAEKIQKNKGFAIMEEGEKPKVSKLLTWLIKSDKKEMKIATSSQLKDWYQYDEGLHSGFEGFSNRLEGLNGNLKKIYSSLSKDMKAKLANFSDDNAKFKQELSKDKALKQSIEKAFKNPKGNEALAKAAFLKTIPTLVGFALTLGTIGIFIPKLNIFVTEMINLNKGKKAADAKRQKSNEVNKAA